jgi:hypothetical protein
VSPGRVKVEHDDAARAARVGRIPLREVLSLAESEARRQAAREGATPGGGSAPGGSGDDPSTA